MQCWAYSLEVFPVLPLLTVQFWAGADSTKINEPENSTQPSSRRQEPKPEMSVPPLEHSENQTYKATIFGKQAPHQVTLMEQIGKDGEDASRFKCCPSSVRW